MLEIVFKAGMSLVLGFFSGRAKNVYFLKEKKNQDLKLILLNLITGFLFT